MSALVVVDETFLAKICTVKLLTASDKMMKISIFTYRFQLGGQSALMDAVPVNRCKRHGILKTLKMKMKTRHKQS